MVCEPVERVALTLQECQRAGRCTVKVWRATVCLIESCNTSFSQSVSSVQFSSVQFSSVQFSSVQDGIIVCAREGPYMRSTPSLRGFPNAALETVPMLV